MPEAAVRRTRDPESRRREIVTAAAELIIEVGVSALTHRMIAARAGVPLGATTQHFSTLDDLRAQALQHLAAEVDERVEAIRLTLREQGATPEVLTAILMRGLADARSMEADRAVVTAAVNDPQLRALARRWSERMASFLADDYGQERATAASIFIDGVLWHSRITDEPLSGALIHNTLTAILGTSTTSAIH